MSEDMDTESCCCVEEEDNSLFSKIEAGCHEGLLIQDLGMSFASIRERIGIEHIVAIATHGSLERYYIWMKKLTGSELKDWVPVAISLYECWLCYTSFSNDPEYSYQVWSHKPYSEAVICRKVDVFALRHRSWRLLKKGKERKFLCAVSRSLAEAEWYRDNPGVRPKPEIMKKIDVGRGFSISGRTRRTAEKKRLTWPSSDLNAVINRAKSLSDRGVEDLVILESGFGLAFNKEMESSWGMLLKIDLHYEQNFSLMTLCEKLQEFI